MTTSAIICQQSSGDWTSKLTGIIKSVYNVIRTIYVKKGEPPMNRLPASGFALVLVLLLLSPALAQKASPDWKTLKPGVQVLKLWDKIGPEQPQIAIFQLSSEAYKDFQQNPKAFVDGYMIFGEHVRPGASLTELLSAPKGYSGEWTATCFHRVSTVRCASYPVEPDSK
jgi:hypothetical protein